MQSEHGNRLDTKIMKRPYAPDHIRFTTGLIRLPTASNSIQQHPTGATAIDSHHQQSPAIARLQTFIHPMLKLSALTVTIRNLLQQVLPVASAQKIRVCFSDSISALLHSEFQNGILLEKLWVLWVLTDESLIIWIQMVSVLSWRSDCNSTFS